MDGPTAVAVLGVRPGATKPELVRAFRIRAKQVHPDAAGSDEAFVALRAAFDLLVATTAQAAPAPTPIGGSGPDRWIRPTPATRPTLDLTDGAVAAARPAPPAGLGRRSPQAAPDGSSARHFERCLAAELTRCGPR